VIRKEFVELLLSSIILPMMKIVVELLFSSIILPIMEIGRG
jgi:hypothetical protein